MLMTGVVKSRDDLAAQFLKENCCGAHLTSKIGGPEPALRELGPAASKTTLINWAVLVAETPPQLRLAGARVAPFCYNRNAAIGASDGRSQITCIR